MQLKSILGKKITRLSEYLFNKELKKNYPIFLASEIFADMIILQWFDISTQCLSTRKTDKFIGLNVAIKTPKGHIIIGRFIEPDDKIAKENKQRRRNRMFHLAMARYFRVFDARNTLTDIIDGITLIENDIPIITNEPDVKAYEYERFQRRVEKYFKTWKQFPYLNTFKCLRSDGKDPSLDDIRDLIDDLKKTCLYFRGVRREFGRLFQEVIIQHLNEAKYMESV